MQISEQQPFQAGWAQQQRIQLKCSSFSLFEEYSRKHAQTTVYSWIWIIMLIADCYENAINTENIC